MRIASLVLGLLGSLPVVILGIVWVGQYKELERSELYQSVLEERQKGHSDPELENAIGTAERTANAGYASFGLGILAFLAATVVFKFPKLSGAVMAAAVLVPAVLAPKSLIFSFLLLIAAVLAFRIKPRHAAALVLLVVGTLLGACGLDATAAPPAHGAAGAGTATTKAAAPASDLYSCNEKAKTGTCAEYSGDALVVGVDVLKGACDGLGGTFAKGACPTADLLGRCVLSGGTVDLYYPSPAHQDAAAARQDCVDLYRGKWTAR